MLARPLCFLKLTSLNYPGFINYHSESWRLVGTFGNDSVYPCYWVSNYLYEFPFIFCQKITYVASGFAVVKLAIEGFPPVCLPQFNVGFLSTEARTVDFEGVIFQSATEVGTVIGRCFCIGWGTIQLGRNAFSRHEKRQGRCLHICPFGDKSSKQSLIYDTKKPYSKTLFLFMYIYFVRDPTIFSSLVNYFQFMRIAYFTFCLCLVSFKKLSLSAIALYTKDI